MKARLNVAICGPFSGPRAAYGEMLKSLANRYLGQSRALGFECFDDQAKPDAAVAAAKQIIDSGFDIVFGHFNSYCSLAVAPLYQAAKMPFIAPLSTHQNLNLYRGGAIFCPSDADQIDVLAQVIKPELNRVYIVHDGSKYSDNFVTLAKQRFNSVILVECQERFSPQNNDLVFLAGAHCNLITPHLRLRASSGDVTIVACDDCFIDEYFEAVKHGINENDFVVGQMGGHKGNLEQAFEYLTSLLGQTVTLQIETDMFDRVGKPLGKFEFNDCGRLVSSDWQRLSMAQLVLGSSSIEV